MRNTELVHAPVDRFARLKKRALEEGLVISLAVVMGHAARRMPGGKLPEIRQTPLHQRQHAPRQGQFGKTPRADTHASDGRAASTPFVKDCA